MKKTILGLLSLGCIFIVGCTDEKVEKSESLREVYFKIAEKQLEPLYTLKNKNRETSLSTLHSDIEDSENNYMYTASRDNLKEHKKILEKLNENKGKWKETYLKVIENVTSTNDMNIEYIKHLLGVDYNINEYSYDVDQSLGLNIVEYTFETDDEMFMIQYVKEKDKILNVFYNDKNINTISTVVDNKLINEKDKLHTGIITYVDGLDKRS